MCGYTRPNWQDGYYTVESSELREPENFCIFPIMTV